MSGIATICVVVGETFGGPDHYRLVERPAPRPDPGEILVAVRAVGLGHAAASTSA